MTSSDITASGVATLRIAADAVIPGDGDTIWMSGAVDVSSDGTIVAAGPESEMPDSPAERLNIGGLLIPGFVNAHAHSPMSLVRSVGDGAQLDDWLRNHVWPREWQMTSDDAYWAMLLGASEMLKNGVTTSVEMYLHEARIIEATLAAGMRVVADGAIFSALVETNSGRDATNRLDELDAVAAEHKDNELVAVGYGPHSLYDLPPEVIAQIAERATQTGAPVTIHLEETQAERQLVLDRHGKSATELLAESGLLDTNLICAHGVWLSDADEQLVHAHAAAIAHCPSSNLKLGSGVAPTTRWSERGINIALGTDGPASNDRIDLWDEMRLAALIARGTNHDPAVASPAEVLGWATSGGGQALGRPDIGRLSPGSRADVVRIDLDQPAFLPGLPADLVTHLVFSGSSRDITDVWVSGKQVVQDRQLVTVDLAEIRHRVRSAAERIAANL